MNPIERNEMPENELPDVSVEDTDEVIFDFSDVLIYAALGGIAGVFVGVTATLAGIGLWRSLFFR